MPRRAAQDHSTQTSPVDMADGVDVVDVPPVPEDVVEAVRTVSGAPSNDPRALEKALGLRIRQLRRQQDLSVADLASSAGLSTGMLSKIENGQISASLTSIHSLAQALSVPMSSLFALAEERHDCSFVAAGEGVKIERRGTKSGHVYQLLGHLLSGEMAIEPYLITLSDGAVPYTSFAHAGTELIHMLEGTLSYRHGNRLYKLSPGDTLLFDSQAQHGPEELGEGTLRYLSIIVYPRGSRGG
ncbi:MAG TPA: XRE family transcriptional regulator [Novosphingobium capsulatum]|nr:XRE family transcriptional regulator [Novosphingobium capsulatum]